MWPSTLQNSGLAGVTRAAGVGPFSATASGDGATMLAESIFTALSPAPTRPLHVAAASPVIFAAVASVAMSEVASVSNAKGIEVRVLDLIRRIVVPRNHSRVVPALRLTMMYGTQASIEINLG
jgi:hypothetical protein